MLVGNCTEPINDSEYLPQSGATYDSTITRPHSATHEQHQQQQQQQQHKYSFTTWERDEGNGKCPSCTISEHHNMTTQQVHVDIQVKHDGVGLDYTSYYSVATS